MVFSYPRVRPTASTRW